MIALWLFAILTALAAGVHIALEIYQQDARYIVGTVMVHFAIYGGLLVLAAEYGTTAFNVYAFAAPYLAQALIKLLYRDVRDEWRQARARSREVDQEIAALRSTRQPQPSKNTTRF